MPESFFSLLSIQRLPKNIQKTYGDGHAPASEARSPSTSSRASDSLCCARRVCLLVFFVMQACHKTSPSAPVKTLISLIRRGRAGSMSVVSPKNFRFKITGHSSRPRFWHADCFSTARREIIGPFWKTPSVCSQITNSIPSLRWAANQSSSWIPAAMAAICPGMAMHLRH
jgi:hypothetical protein